MTQAVTNTAPPVPRRATETKAADVVIGQYVYFPFNPDRHQWQKVLKRGKTVDGFIMLVGATWSRQFRPDVVLYTRPGKTK